MNQAEATQTLRRLVELMDADCTCEACSASREALVATASVQPQVGAASEPQRLDSAVEANRALLLERSQLGIQKYGGTLGEKRYSERQILQHALEEALDLANYLMARIQAIDAAIQQAKPAGEKS